MLKHISPMRMDSEASPIAVSRWTGASGVASGVLLVVAFPLCIMMGTPPPPWVCVRRATRNGLKKGRSGACQYRRHDQTSLSNRFVE